MNKKLEQEAKEDLGEGYDPDAPGSLQERLKKKMEKVNKKDLAED